MTDRLRADGRALDAGGPCRRSDEAAGRRGWRGATDDGRCAAGPGMIGTTPDLPGRFRLQLFTTEGTRPVAVATQVPARRG